MTSIIKNFSFDGKSIYIPAADLYLDSRKKTINGYVSHAHGDHIAKHELTLCTPETADLLKLRIQNPRCITIPYFQKTMWKDTYITLFPAGHILGSAQIFIESGGSSLLYTGDFKTSKSFTVQPFVPVSADVVIMETTFGKPKFCFPPRDETEKKLVTIVGDKLKHNIIPVVFAYSLGKSQEALHILSHAGFSVAVDRSIIRYCRIYEKYGMRFGEYEKLDKENVQGKVVLLSAHKRSVFNLSRFGRTYTIYLSGWGMEEAARQRFRVDHELNQKKYIAPMVSKK
jgi:Cft2 family RNA processing exonuclease